MVTAEEFKSIALIFPGTLEAPHFDRIAFKVIKRKTFATLLEKNFSANILLSRKDQPLFCSYNTASVYPVDNKWGLQGWTTFNLQEVNRELISAALEAGYNNVLKG